MIWVVVVVVSVVCLVGLLTVVGRVARRQVTNVMTDPSVVGSIASAPANMPGGQPGAGSAVGGLGVLALFPDELRFVLAVPRRVITMPLADITETTVDSALRQPGRYRRGGPPFLVVHWINAEGGRSTGFQLAEAERFKTAIGR